MRGRKIDIKSGNRRFSLLYGKFYIHPLFLFFGVWNAIAGNLLDFCSVAICAVVHELAHAAEAAKYGFGVKQLVLMPYGATIDMDLEGVSTFDEIRIALAGPICNFLIAVGFLALWWCFPSTYPYTESAFYTTLSLAVCNLIPAYPLDGGRVLFCLLYKSLNAYLPPEKSKKYTKIITRILSFSTCAIGLICFIFGVFHRQPNYSLLFFIIFLIIGLFEKQKTVYCKLDFSNRRAFERGIPVKHIAVSDDCTIKKALTFLSPSDYLILDVYNQNEHFIGSLTQSELSDFFQKTHLYAILGEYFSNFP